MIGIEYVDIASPRVVVTGIATADHIFTISQFPFNFKTLMRRFPCFLMDTQPAALSAFL